MIFLRKNYFRKGLKLCAHAHDYPPIYYFFISILFPVGDFRSSVGFLLFGSYFRVVSAECVLCLIRCFYWVFVCCFLIPGLCRGLFGDFGLFYGIFLMLAKMMGVSVNLCKTWVFRV